MRLDLMNDIEHVTQKYPKSDSYNTKSNALLTNIQYNTHINLCCPLVGAGFFSNFFSPPKFVTSFTAKIRQDDNY